MNDNTCSIIIESIFEKQPEQYCEVVNISVLNKADIALIISIAAVAALGFGYLASVRSGGGYADIIRHGEVVQTLELATDTLYTAVEDGLINIVQTSGGAAAVVDANCPDGHCLRQAPIMYTGQTIVCLPNRLVIQIRASGDGEHDVILR